MTSFDEASMTSGYARYLAAKTSVDDRALNRHVLAELRRLMPAGAPRVLEVGAGLEEASCCGLGKRTHERPARGVRHVADPPGDQVGDPACSDGHLTSGAATVTISVTPQSDPPSER